MRRPVLPLLPWIPAVACALAVASCTTFAPTTRSEVTFVSDASRSQFQTAVKNAGERLGGTIVLRGLGSPRSAEVTDTNRRDLQATLVGYIAPTAGSTLDSVLWRPISDDSSIVVVHGFFPYLEAAAIAEEIDFPRPLLSATERLAAVPAMTEKSRVLFSGLSLISPAIGTTYLLINNPFARDISEVVSILVPLTLDAGFLYFLFSEHGVARPGTYVLGAAATYMRISNVFGLSAEIDRYNILARSGYHLGLEDITYDLSTRFTFHVRIP